MWAEKVINDLKKEIDLEQDEVIFLAGERYRRFLLPYVKNGVVPMKRLTIGKQLQYLKEKTK
ncbi:DUF6884 domain-containing protein [Clostridium kluyveri]|uniref:DUF6884 domain-containing protein n=1 Tax=Clostridium kluyveri TaxID=1534 RepID=UPI002AFEF900|nr:DUF6884 domain-containing protein [Clostridium kluyveri]